MSNDNINSVARSTDITDDEIYKELLMSVDTNISLDSVILSTINKEKIKGFLQENDNRAKLLRYNLRPTNRLLFYGASGCGKTFLGKALCNYMGYTMLYVDIATSLSQGKVAINLSNIFRLANKLGKCMIFLDEADSIAWRRDSDTAEGGDIRRATNSLFQLLDQMSPDVVVVCATNMLHRLDPAFERRFDLKLQFDRPEKNLREILRKFIYDDFVLVIDRVDEVVERRSRLSFYELQGVAERMMKKAVINNTNKILMTDVYLEMARAMNVKVGFHTDTDDYFKA